MKTRAKIRRSVKAVSPVISVLLMIAIAVAASLIAYAWIMGYIGGTTTKAGKAILIQSQAPGFSGIDLYVQNVGQSSVTFDPSGSVYINDELQDSGVIFDKTTLDPGDTAWIQTSYPWMQSFKAKIVTTDGTFTEKTGYYENTGSSVTYSVTFILDTGGKTMAPTPGPHSYGGTIEISATHDTDYVFEEWIATGGLITFAESHSASTTATINGAGTITATFTYSPGITTYQVSFDGSGYTGDATGNLVSFTVTDGSYSGDNSPIGVAGGSIMVDSGATVEYTFVGPVTSSVVDKQYRLDSVSGSTSGFTVSDTTEVTGNYQAQYYLTVTGGNSPSGQNWYDSGSPATASNAWVWSQVAGQSRQALTNWQLDGANQNPTRANTGTFTTSSITMDAAHTVNFVSTTQNYLTVTGGHSIGFGTASQTGDQWYDSTSSTTVTSDWVWGIVPDESRYAITNYAIDSADQNPTRQYAGTLTTSSVSMTTYHTIAFAAATQYEVTFAATGSGSVTTPATSPQWYDSGAASISIEASPSGSFSSWSCSPALSVTFNNENSASTTITQVSGASEVTANFALPKIYVTSENDLHTPSDVGSLSSFANMQDDAVSYATLTEGDVGGTQTWITPTGDSGSNWANRGYAHDDDTDTYSEDDIGSSSSSEIVLSYSATTGTKIRFWITRESSDINRLVIDVYNTGTSNWQNVFDSNPSTTGQWVEVTFSSRTTNQVRLRFYNSHWFYNRWARVHEVNVLSVEPTNYQLDQEVQFSGVSASYTQLQINTGTFSGSEGLQVYYWRSSDSTWQLLGTLTASNLKTFDVTGLVGTTFDLRFYDATRTSDATQNTWQIDYVRLVAP